MAEAVGIGGEEVFEGCEMIAATAVVTDQFVALGISSLEHEGDCLSIELATEHDDGSVIGHVIFQNRNLFRRRSKLSASSSVHLSLVVRDGLCSLEQTELGREKQKAVAKGITFIPKRFGDRTMMPAIVFHEGRPLTSHLIGSAVHDKQHGIILIPLYGLWILLYC